MGFSNSGIYTRYDGTRTTWQDDATADVKIEADLHDEHDNDLGDALSQMICKNGISVVTEDIPWNGKKITNLGAATTDTDAPNYSQVKSWKEFKTGIIITGADADGRITFQGTGVNGLSWTIPDLFWGAKAAKAGETSNRLVMNSSANPPSPGNTGDVFVIDEVGRINNAGVLSYNLSWEGANIRTISPGTGTRINYTNGVVAFGSNDVATITNPYATATIRNFSTFHNSAGSTFVTLDKSASGKYNRITATMATKARWTMDLGNATPETATDRVGSDFYLYSYNNAGTVAFAEMSISRATHNVTFGGNVIATGDGFGSTSANVILYGTGAAGAVILRPRGYSDAACQFTVDATAGDVTVAATGGVLGGKGYRTHSQSTTGGYGANYFNFNWDGTYVKSYIDNSFAGNIMWQASDYRIKRDIAPLPSMWDKVKALSPISWKQKAFGIYEDNDAPRWGFVAHELQDRLGKHAASGEKDGDDVQTIDMMAVVTALTKALQEAMARIEVLEAAA